MDEHPQAPEAEESLIDMALVMSRMAADTGARTDLDEVMARLGIDKVELEAEIDAGLHSLG